MSKPALSRQRQMDSRVGQGRPLGGVALGTDLSAGVSGVTRDRGNGRAVPKYLAPWGRPIAKWEPQPDVPRPERDLLTRQRFLRRQRELAVGVVAHRDVKVGRGPGEGVAGLAQSLAGPRGAWANVLVTDLDTARAQAEDGSAS
jgi:hypothetical protein